MGNIRELIESESKGERIDAVVIYQISEYKKFPNHQSFPLNIILTWEESLPWIDCDLDDNFIRSIYAWTENKVIFNDYTESEGDFMTSVPRHPIKEPNDE